MHGRYNSLAWSIDCLMQNCSISSANSSSCWTDWHIIFTCHSYCTKMCINLICLKLYCTDMWLWYQHVFFTVHMYEMFNSLAPGKYEWNFRHVIFKQILVIDDWGISCEIALTWKPQDLTDDKSTLVQVMAWCRQATSHYLSQCWPSSLSPYGVIRPQWVNCFNFIFDLVVPYGITTIWHHWLGYWHVAWWNQAITWTNVPLLSTGTSGTSFSDILNNIQMISLMNMHLIMLSAKCWQFCWGLNSLRPSDAYMRQ